MFAPKTRTILKPVSNSQNAPYLQILQRTKEKIIKILIQGAGAHRISQKTSGKPKKALQIVYQDCDRKVSFLLWPHKVSTETAEMP